MLIILAHCLDGGLVSVRPIFLSGSIHRDRLTYQYWTDVVEAPTNTHPLLHTINNNQQLSQGSYRLTYFSTGLMWYYHPPIPLYYYIQHVSHRHTDNSRAYPQPKYPYQQHILQDNIFTLHLN